MQRSARDLQRFVSYISADAICSNNRSKFNVALGIDAQGFCMIKAHQAPGS
jgi:hypothetical protein